MRKVIGFQMSLNDKSLEAVWNYFLSKYFDHSSPPGERGRDKALLSDSYATKHHHREVVPSKSKEPIRSAQKDPNSELDLDQAVHNIPASHVAAPVGIVEGSPDKSNVAAGGACNSQQDPFKG